MTPYDWTGPSFLGLLGLVSINACGVAYWYRQTQIANVRGNFADAKPKLHTYELAYLSGGAETAILSAVASLVQTKSVEVTPAFGSLFLHSKSIHNAEPHPLVTEVMHALSHMQTDSIRTAVGKIKSRGLRSLTEIQSRLEQEKLILSVQRSAEIASTSAMIMAVPAVLAIPKIFIGMERHRPVGFLLIAIAVIIAAAFAFWKAKPFRSQSGDSVLQREKFEQSALHSTARSNSQILSGQQAAMAVALFSVSVFGIGPLYDLRKAIAPPASSSGSFSSSSCGGGSCGGGCGGGCGGCGG